MFKITNIKIKPIYSNSNIKAYASITLDDCKITIKVIRNAQVSMDSSRKPDITGFQIISMAIDNDFVTFN